MKKLLLTIAFLCMLGASIAYMADWPWTMALLLAIGIVIIFVFPAPPKEAAK